MKRIETFLRSRSHVTTVADIVGGGLVVAGVALVFVPAALILAGVLIVTASILTARAGT